MIGRKFSLLLVLRAQTPMEIIQCEWGMDLKRAEDGIHFGSAFGIRELGSFSNATFG